MESSTGGGLGYTLMHAAQRWRIDATAVLKPHGVTVPQFLVLMELHRRARHNGAPLTQSEVAMRLGMDANTASQISRTLERNGLISRGKHPVDGRANTLELTTVGGRVARDSSADARAMNDRFFSVANPDDRAALERILTTVSTESEGRP